MRPIAAAQAWTSPTNQCHPFHPNWTSTIHKNGLARTIIKTGFTRIPLSIECSLIFCHFYHFGLMMKKILLSFRTFCAETAPSFFFRPLSIQTERHLFLTHVFSLASLLSTVDHLFLSLAEGLSRPSGAGGGGASTRRPQWLRAQWRGSGWQERRGWGWRWGMGDVAPPTKRWWAVRLGWAPRIGVAVGEVAHRAGVERAGAPPSLCLLCFLSHDSTSWPRDIIIWENV